ncbi:MAG: hypothetical protein KDA45_09855 [Planctomycetales bacterium]|nr:hypothetical protein [Planctomycetales bacterium]
MDGGRGFRGWLAAITVAVMLTLVLLAVEKHLRLPTADFFQSPGSSTVAGATTAHRGIRLSIDPGLAGVTHFPASDATPLQRKTQPLAAVGAASFLRRPPEPAAHVVLQAPVALDQLTALPLHSGSSQLDFLMDTMDKALESPIRAVSTRRVVEQASFPLSVNRLASLPLPASIGGRLPEPKSLFADLSRLQQWLAAAPHQPSATAHSVSVYRGPRGMLSLAESQTIGAWLEQTQGLLQQVVLEHGLEHPACGHELDQLGALAAQGAELGNRLEDYEAAKQLLNVGYAVHRRVVVWQAIRQCLQREAASVPAARDANVARQELAQAIAQVELKLQDTGDAAAWRKYLLLPELTDWVQSPQDIWQEGNHLALSCLSRLHWQRLSHAQQQFLAQAAFEELAAHLSVWGREPVDYRQLLTELEALEQEPISRVNCSLADAVQILRLSQDDPQKQLAGALNDHYRNANIRLSVSQELIQRMLPEDQYAVRPVRQRILGADTAGDSAVRTELRLKLIPDENAWNIGLGVQGELVSATRSSKGPAVFHNTSTAQIDSLRYLRMDPMGYRVAAEPTNVDSQDQLQKMSTNFDSLPIIGDLARWLVREQFNQKRGLAQRITRRIIAEEADAEFDRQLEKNLADAEQQLQQRLLGPLERLQLNPIVVAMNTTEDRLTIRYRVANERQMAAHTPRPRAPSDSLLSLQVHQTVINNTIGQLGLSGRTWSLPDLYARLGEAFQNSRWELPPDVPSDLTVRFADTRPVTVEMVDGKLRLTLRIAELKQADRLHIERFIVTSSYIPVADGLHAELIRDGVVEIDSYHSRDRFRLRVIFAKVFVSNPLIPLIASSWIDDPRAEGLAVSQVEIRDGWLAVAISPADSLHAAQVASRAQQLRRLQ